MTKHKVLGNLKKLIGYKIDMDEIICAFEDFEEDGETEVCIGESHNAGYDYVAYINTIGSTQFLFTLNNGFIENVRIAEN